MATIEFYYMPESPPCRTVEMVAELTGVKLNKHYVNLFTKDQLKDDYIKLNPLHKVPFIIDGDLKINESRAIVCYLANKYSGAKNTLYPVDPIERAKVDELLYFDIGSLYQSSSKYFMPRVFGGPKELDPEAEKAFRSNLSYLNDRLKANGGKKFLLGDDITVADISIMSSFCVPEANEYDMSEFKDLLSYITRLKGSIPKYHEINDEANENLKKFIQSKLAGAN